MKILNLIEKIPLGYRVTLVIIFAVLSPFLFTRPWSETFYFDNTGQIGDTIGGLTAPVIGLLNAWLLYITLKRQDKQISLQIIQFDEQRRYAEYDRRMDQIKDIIASSHFSLGYKNFPNQAREEKKGSEALIMITILFNISSWNPVIKYDFKKTELLVLILKLMEVNAEALTILHQNEISNRTLTEKNFVIDSVKRGLAVVIDLYRQVQDFDKSFPAHEKRGELQISKILELKTLLEARLGPV